MNFNNHTTQKNFTDEFNSMFECCRQKDLENFLDHTRAKFVGLQVQNDSKSLAGLPPSIHEGVKVLKQVSVKAFTIK